MTRINTNVQSLRGLRNLQKSSNMLDQSLTRLSTGVKINSGRDNPSGLIASETLRLQVTTIEQSIKNSNRANNVIGTADSALGEIAGLLNQVRGLVQEGLNDGALSQAEKEANQLQIDTALSAINRISANTAFAGDKLIDGSKAFNTSISTANASKLTDFQVNEAVFGTSSSIQVDAEVTSSAEKAELRYDGGNLSAATTLELAGSEGSQVLFLGSGSSVVNARDAINSVSEATGVEAVLLEALQSGGGATNAEFEFTAIDGVESTREFQLDPAVQALGATLTGDNTDTDGDTASLRIGAVSGGAFDGAAGNDVEIRFVATGGGVSASYDSANNRLTIDLDNTAGGVNTSAAISAAVANATNAVGEFEVIDVLADAGDDFDNIAAAPPADANLSGGEDNSVVFTAATAGAAGDNISIQFLQGADGADTSVAVDNSDPDNVTVTFTLSAAAGAVTETAAGLATFLTSDTSDSANLARQYISATGDGTAAITTLTGNTLTGGSDAADIVFRAVDSGTGGNNISVNLVQGADGASTSVSVDDSDPDDVQITFTLSAAAGAITETVDGLVSFLSENASTEAAEARAYISATGSSTSAIENNSAGLQSLSGGAATSGGVRFVDGRAAGSNGSLSIRLADPGAANESLSATVTDADAEGNQTITFNLATDGTGATTTTAAQLASFIAGDETLSSLLTAESTVDGVLQAASTAALAEGEDSVLVLQSQNYGTQESVEINVLNGSFTTTLSDSSTAASRDVGANIGVTINGQAAFTNGLKASIRTSSLDAAITFAEGSNSIGETASLTIDGGGSLFQIGQDVSAAGQIGIGIEAMNTARLGGISGKLFELGTGNGKSLLDVGQGGVSGKDLVNIIDQSLDRVTTLRGRLGALQKNVIETNISTLGVALENISEARSQIVDTDFAEETAAMTKSQILSQSGISVLAIANQNPGQVLSLLG